MNSERILKELEAVLIRYRAGLLTEQQAKQEASMLQVMLRAYEQSVIEEKLEAVMSVLEMRDNGR